MAGIPVLHPVSHSRLSNSLSNSIDLRSVATTGDANPDVDRGKVIFTEHKDGFVDLVTEDSRLYELQRLAVDTNKTPALLCVGNSCSCLEICDRDP
jgi:hypothetical protein